MQSGRLLGVGRRILHAVVSTATLSLAVVVVPVAPSHAATSFSFGSVGDHAATARSASVFQAVGASGVDFFLSLGDLSYDQLTPPAWCQMVKDNINLGAGHPVGDVYGEQFPFEIVGGNHETGTLDQYLTSTCLPDRLGATSSPSGTYGREYYFDYPAGAPLARFIGIYPGLGYSYAAGSAHYQWLGNAIDQARAQGVRWVIVMNHLDHMSTGPKLDEIGPDVFNLLVSKKVDLILEGHDHTYQRSKQLALGPACPVVALGQVDQDCIVGTGAAGQYVAGAGSVLLINGVGGQTNYTVDPADPEAGYFARIRGGGSEGAFSGFSRFTVDASQIAMSYVSATGTFTDAFSITADGDPLPPDVSAPSVPSGLVGSVAADGSRVDLSWVASTDDRGVAGYRVVRDGVVVAPSVPSASYADGSVVPGRTYQYVVRAFDAAGNVSGDSAPVSVTTPAGSQVLRSESFSAADGSAWPAGWVSSVGGGGVVDVQGGGGRLQFADVANSFGRSVLGGVPAVADEELLTSYRWGQTSGLGYFNVWLRGSGGWQNAYRPSSGYGLQLVSNSGAVVVSKNVGGVTSTLRSEPAGSRVSTAKQWLRFRVVGQQVMFRTWLDGQPEPTTWTWSGTDSSVSAPGQLFVSVVRSSTNTGVKNVTLDDLVLSRGGQVSPGDTTPPTAPTGLDAEADPSGTDVELTWTAATDDVGVTGYRVLRDGQLVATIEPATFFEDGVAPGHTYTYAVRALDAAGNLGPISNAVTVTTPLPPDVSAPSVPSGLVGSVAADGSRVDLSWVASTDDRGVAGYRVVRDGVVVAPSVPSASYADGSVVPGRTYQYVVRAFDAAGNVSGDSAPVSVTTPAGSQVLRSESFSAADGSAWPAGWVSSVGGGGVVDVQGGGGRLQFADVANSFGRSVLGGVPAVADEELLTSYRWGQTSGLGYFNVWLRGSGGWQNAYRPSSGYGLQLVSNSGAVVVSKNVGGVTSTLRSEPAGSRVSTAKQWLRFRVVGQQVMFRTWLDGQPEPTTWTWSGTDSSVSAPGQLFVSVVRSSTNTGVKNVTLDDLVLSRS